MSRGTRIAKTRIVVTEKQCNKCGIIKPVSAFAKRQSHSTGFEMKCKQCYAEWYRRDKAADPDKYTHRWREGSRKGETYDAYYRRQYGLAPGQYNQMAKAQGGVCFVCGDPPFVGRRLCVDHNHNTGQVRRLLCNGCNSAIGYSKEQPERLRKLAQYLESHQP